jgi:hypothetical protein
MRRLSLWLLPLFLVAAKPAPKTAPKDLASPAASAGPMALTDLQVAALELLSPGAEPRRVVAYAPRSGAVVEYEVVANTQMKMEVIQPDGTPAPMPDLGTLPAIVLTHRNTVGRPDASGQTPIEVAVLGGRLEGKSSPEIEAGMLQGVNQTKGLKLNLVIDPQGKVAGVQYNDVDPNLAQVTQQLGKQFQDRLTPFPNEPIGLGARWSQSTTMNLGGMQVGAVQTYELQEFTAQGVELAITIDLKLSGGLPNLPAGAKGELQYFNGKGSGQFDIDLGTLVSTGTMDLDMDLKMSVQDPSQGTEGTATMTLQLDQQSTVRPTTP